MSWRFRKSIELFEGLRLYVTHRGVSATARAADTGVSYNKRLLELTKGDAAGPSQAPPASELPTAPDVSVPSMTPDVDVSGSLDGETVAALIDPESAVGCIGCLAGCFIATFKLVAVCFVLWFGFGFVSGLWEAGHKRLKARNDAAQQLPEAIPESVSVPVVTTVQPTIPAEAPPVAPPAQEPVKPPADPLPPSADESKQNDERLAKARKRLDSAKGQSSPYARVTLLKGVVRDFPGTALAEEATQAISEAEQQIAEREGRSR